jgi:hypothetical protein
LRGSDVCLSELDHCPGGADPERLSCDREYKEQHRPALTAYYCDRVDEQPNYRQENCLKLVNDNAGVDVLFITGMREQGAVAAVAHLVPGTRVFEVRVQTNDEERRRSRGGNAVSTQHIVQNSRVSLVFDNDAAGEEAAISFLKRRLVPLFDEDLPRLAKMVPIVVDFPHRGVTFRDVLKIAQQQAGLKLCTSLMQRLYDVDWTSIDAVVCCETGCYVFASALAFSVEDECFEDAVICRISNGDGRRRRPFGEHCEGKILTRGVTLNMHDLAMFEGKRLTGPAEERWPGDVGGDSVKQSSAASLHFDWFASQKFLPGFWRCF